MLTTSLAYMCFGGFIQFTCIIMYSIIEVNIITNMNLPEDIFIKSNYNKSKNAYSMIRIIFNPFQVKIDKYWSILLKQIKF